MIKHHTTALGRNAFACSLIAAFALTAAPAFADRAGNAASSRQTVSAKPQRVWVASGDINGDGRSARPGRTRMQQNGTTVATAGDVQAPAQKGPHLLVPAVQRSSAQAQPQPTRMEQNGTTVATAGNVQAPQTPEQPALLVPAVQKAQAAPQKAKLKQNGTTVATASDVAAPTRD